MRAACRWLLGRWRAADGKARLDAARASADRRVAAETAARRASDAALDAARALDAGEWDNAAELLDRARRDAREARTLDAVDLRMAGGWA